MQSNESNAEMEIDLQEIFGLLIHKFWMILIAAVVAAAVGFGISKFVLVPQYESTTKIYVLNKNDNNMNNGVGISDFQLANYMIKDYAALIKSRNVLESVIEKCGLVMSYEELASRVSVSNEADTRIITITVQHPDPMVAQFVTKKVRDVAAEHIKNVMLSEAVNVVDDANLPAAPASPKVSRWTAIGGLAGAVLIALIIIIRFLMDDTIKTSEDVERYLGLSTLAMIPVNGASDHDSKGKGRAKQKVDPVIAALDKTFVEDDTPDHKEEKTEETK